MVHKLLSTRGGTVALSGAAALLAAAILLGYLHRYRESVNDSSRPMTVLVAADLIEKGTPGNVVGTEALFQASTVPRDELKEGAIVDPASLKGRVAAEDIYPGQQLTVADFAVGDADAVSTKVLEYERGISVPLDTAHGMIGKVLPGDHVDVIAAFNVEGMDGRNEPVSFVLAQDVLVLDAPSETATAGIGAGPTATKTVVLRLTDEESAETAYAVEYGKIWIVVRPKSGAEQHRPSVVTLSRMLLGIKPIPAARQEGSAPRSGERR
ncbi:MAG: Flp pilus assembly protein CpaB [Gaiellaceae bacterium]